VIFSPAIRKSLLTLHVTASVGWFGAVAAFFVLALTGLRSPDDAAVRATCIAAELITKWLIVPMCWATLATGVAQGWGTKWGLLQHHWVVAKLFITGVSTAVLLVHSRPIRALARAASDPTSSISALRSVRVQLAVDSGAALVALLVAIAFSTFKPRGLTSFGRATSVSRRGAA
jgi:hypothetical protein